MPELKKYIELYGKNKAKLDLSLLSDLDIKCCKAGLTPSAVVIVATIRALKMHDLQRPSLRKGSSCS